MQPTPLVPGQFDTFIRSLTGRRLGVFKTAARRSGLTLDEYITRLDSGDKRCIVCKNWLPRSQFNPDTTRWDGMDAKCTICRNATARDAYVPVPDDQRQPKGPPRYEPRDGDKVQARHLINKDIRNGVRPNPNDLHCAHCGHKGADRRHEYHHHMGYAARNHYDVIPLCSKCHHDEH
jgi:5-methylcytosine-specific restriction endonuclease McrA